MKICKKFIIIAAIVWSIFGLPYAFAKGFPDGTGVRIGVIDTGVVENTDVWPAGRVEAGKNYVFPEKTTADKMGHGTRVTSLIIGAKTEDGSITGTAPEATIIPLVYQSRYPSGVVRNGGVKSLSQAIIDAIDIYDCNVICISSGTPVESRVLKDAVDYAEEKGVIVVAAVGNDNKTEPEKVYYPAAYGTVIGTGAIDKNNVVSDFSQRHGVFVVTDGRELQALDLDGEIKTFSGTSYANARMAGIVAQLLSVEPNSTPSEIRAVLALSAVDLGEAGYDSAYGWGAVDAQAAIDILNNDAILELSGAKDPLDSTGPLTVDTDAKKVGTFEDVKENTWYSQSVQTVYTAGLMSGISSTEFGPSQSVSRGMVVTILFRMSGEEKSYKNQELSNIFTDVMADTYYEKAVTWAWENGIINGMGTNTFEPDAFVTREQLAQIFYQYAKYQFTIQEPKDNYLETYSDSSQVSQWAQEGLNWAIEQGLIRGKGENQLAPKDHLTRAEMAVVLAAFIEAK